MKKSCQNCGFENAEKDKFCRKCGNKIEDVKQKVEKKPEQIKQETIEYKRPEPQHRIVNTPPAKEKYEMPSKMVLGIAFVALIISIAAISSAFLVSPSSLAASTVKTEALADDSVTSDKVADGTITDSDINVQGISRIKENSITGSQIVDNTISFIHLTSELNEAITQTVNIKDESVTSEHIKNGTISSDDLANNSITSNKIKDGEVKASDIATGAVTSAEIASDAVDTDELADGAVTYDKMNIKIRFGSDQVKHGDEIDHNLGAVPTSIIVTPRYNSSLPANSVIIVNVYDIDSNSFKIAMSVFDGSGDIIEVDGSTWGEEEVDWIAIR
jgi:hypothetical protein